MKIHSWMYRVDQNPASTIESASTDRSEIRGLVATTYRVDVERIQVWRTTT